MPETIDEKPTDTPRFFTEAELRAWAAKNFVGVMYDPPSLDSIAKKHGVSLEDLKAEMEIGLKVEKEHTEDEATAGVITLHHLDEDARYYSKEQFKNSTSWPTAFKTRHLEPGLVRYDDIGPVDSKTGKPVGLTLLLRQSAIDKMRASFRGRPVVNRVHKNVAPTDFKEGHADGVVTRAWSEGGWDWVEMLVWDEKTKDNCLNGFRTSCAYVPTKMDMTPGVHHNIPYDGEILDGEYTHIAVVNNPRYEQSTIELCNSKGGKMAKESIVDRIKAFFNWKGEKRPIELDQKMELDVEGSKVTLEALVNSYKAEQAAKEKTELENAMKTLTDDTVITVDGKEVLVGDLKAAHKAIKERQNAAEEAAKKAEAEKAEAEKRNAEESAAKEEAEKKAKEEAEIKNAQAEADKKAEAEKKAKEEELKNAQAEADKKAAAEFEALKNANLKRNDVLKDAPPMETLENQLARGKKNYGSPTGEPAKK